MRKQGWGSEGRWERRRLSGDRWCGKSCRGGEGKEEGEGERKRRGRRRGRRRIEGQEAVYFRQSLIVRQKKTMMGNQTSSQDLRSSRSPLPCLEQYYIYRRLYCCPLCNSFEFCVSCHMPNEFCVVMGKIPDLHRSSNLQNRTKSTFDNRSDQEYMYSSLTLHWRTSNFDQGFGPGRTC